MSREKTTVLCNLCPRHCNADRITAGTGFCGMKGTVSFAALHKEEHIMVARAALHAWEEPCISGEHGSGTVFFSGCNLRCCYCQNREIALGNAGKEITLERLAIDCMRLQEQGANNINFVTPTHYIPQVAWTIDYLRNSGAIPGYEGQRLGIPVVYNTGSYEEVSALHRLKGLVDVYLPDLKYISQETGRRYSLAPDYFQKASRAIEEMVRQVGEPEFFREESGSSREKPGLSGEELRCSGEKAGNSKQWLCEPGIMTKGVIVRHLVLPGHTKESKEIIRYLYETYGDSIYISIMNQYTPCADPEKLPEELRRTLTEEEYDEVVNFAIDIGVENGFVQEGDTAKESFIPPFAECEGV